MAIIEKQLAWILTNANPNVGAGIASKPAPT